MQIREERLFERIRHREQSKEQVVDLSAGPYKDQSERSRIKILERSITDHLRYMLNTRQGSVQIADDYGIEDFTNLISEFSSSSIEEIQNSVRSVILKYEPRLSDIRVIYQENRKNFTNGLAFRLESIVRFKESEIPVVFETILEPDGKISVSGQRQSL